MKILFECHQQTNISNTTKADDTNYFIFFVIQSKYVSEKTPAGSGLFTKLYIAAGVLIFISIGYTIFTKPVNTAGNKSASAGGAANTQAANMAGQNNSVADTSAAKVYLNRAFAFYTSKNYHDCISLNRKALELNPDLPQAYNNICSAYNCLGEWDSAIVACNKAIELKPEYDLAKNNLKYSYSQKNAVKN
jgi:tetratricopeptide (TPR) repeat protein